MQTSQDSELNLIERQCRSFLKCKTLTDENFVQIATQIMTQQPSNYKDMLAICRQYMPANMATESNSDTLANELVEVKLLRPLEKVVVADEKSALKKSKKMDADKEQLKMDLKMAEYMNKKASVPQPEVRHEKGNNFNQDINLPLTIIVGGNHLLEDTSLRLTQGTKYGLVGRNGIGKTCLIDGISRQEIEGFPPDIHSLQVE